MSDWKSRATTEKAEVDARLDRLEDEIESESFKSRPLLQQDLMRRQAGYMRAYSLTLKQRLDDAMGCDVEGA